MGGISSYSYPGQPRCAPSSYTMTAKHGSVGASSYSSWLHTPWDICWLVEGKISTNRHVTDESPMPFLTGESRRKEGLLRRMAIVL